MPLPGRDLGPPGRASESGVITFLIQDYGYLGTDICIVKSLSFSLFSQTLSRSEFKVGCGNRGRHVNECVRSTVTLPIVDSHLRLGRKVVLRELIHSFDSSSYCDD